MCASLVSSFQTINSPPNFRSPSSPKRTTPIETRASTLPHRYSLPAIGINPLLSRPKSTRSKGEREARREEGKGGRSWNEKERRKRKRNGGKEERGGTRGFTSLSKMFYSCRVPSPPPSPRFTKRAHRQRVVSNFNYKPRRGELEFSEMRRACETKGVSGDQP